MSESTLNDGDTAWIFVSTALVFLMTPGLSFFYGGLVRGDNVIHTMMMSLVCIAIITLQWFIIGYSLAFSGGNKFIGNGNFSCLKSVGKIPNEIYSPTIPHYAFMTYQLTFAIITPALISGSIVGRIKFKSYLLFLILWSCWVYDPVCHMVWSIWKDDKGITHSGWLRDLGALDFAGGTVVHIISGFSGPIMALFLGSRKQKEEVKPHNIPFVLLGASILWFGWFGFNAGSALAADGLASLAFVNTQIAASAGFVAWMVFDMIVHKPTSAGAVTGGVIGLVGITPAAGFVQPWAAIVIGFVTSFGCYYAIYCKRKYPDFGFFAYIDDSLDVFLCHGLGGVLGALLTGLFATKEVNEFGHNGAFYGNGKQFGIQLLAVVVTAAYAMAVTSIIMLILKFTIGIRVSEEKEIEGLDKSVHGEKAYGTIRGIIIDKFTSSKKLQISRANSNNNNNNNNNSDNIRLTEVAPENTENAPLTIESQNNVQQNLEDV